MFKKFRDVIKDIKKGEIWEGNTIRIICTENVGNIIIEDIDEDQRYKFTILESMWFKLKVVNENGTK